MPLKLLVNIDVDDLQRATEFYCRAFELRPGRQLGDRVVELLGASSAIYLLAKPAGTPAAAGMSQQRDYRRHWTPVHLDFVVADIQSAVVQAQAAGAVLEDEVQTYSWGHIGHMADPFGHGICLIEFISRGYDEIAG
jgi:predicted enzyme related to lactoylglutathione lyase